MQYVVVFQNRKNHSPTQPGDGVDCTLIVDAEGLDKCKTCDWIVVTRLYRLGEEVAL